MPININCKHYDDGHCNTLPKTLRSFRKTCVLILDQSECELQDKFEKPSPPPPPPPKKKEQKMSEKTPKEQFLNELVKVVCEFERKTGVNVHTIYFPDRIDTRDFSDIGETTSLTLIRLELK